MIESAWFKLSEAERLALVLEIRCPEGQNGCGAKVDRPCSRGPKDPCWIRLRMRQIRYDRLADEISRTCPWCGWLAPGELELELHEEECES